MRTPRGGVTLKGDQGARQGPVLKTFTGFEIKDAEKGEVEAIIATLGVVDHDGDIIAKDAVLSGAKVAMSDYGHTAVFGKRPVGKGTLSVEGNKLKFTGRLFMTTTDGRETFAVLKEMGADQEWSFGFETLGSEKPDEKQRGQGAFRIITKMDAFEVSPVIRGAGIATRTLAVKAEGGATEPQADGSGEAPTAAALPVATPPEPPETKAAEELARRAAEQAAIHREFERLLRTQRKHNAA